MGWGEQMGPPPCEVGPAPHTRHRMGGFDADAHRRDEAKLQKVELVADAALSQSKVLPQGYALEVALEALRIVLKVTRGET